MHRMEVADNTRDSRSRRRAWPVIATWVVACVSILAGVGVVGMRPEPPASVSLGTRQSGEVRVLSDRVLEITFNPRTSRGLKIAKVAFRFTYRIPPADREVARARIDGEWDRLISRCLGVLMRRTARELKESPGLEVIEVELSRAIGDVLFPDSVGRVEEILWQQRVVQ